MRDRVGVRLEPNVRMRQRRQVHRRAAVVVQVLMQGLAHLLRLLLGHCLLILRRQAVALVRVDLLLKLPQGHVILLVIHQVFVHLLLASHREEGMLQTLHLLSFLQATEGAAGCGLR